MADLHSAAMTRNQNKVKKLVVPINIKWKWSAFWYFYNKIYIISAIVSANWENKITKSTELTKLFL